MIPDIDKAQQEKLQKHASDLTHAHGINGRIVQLEDNTVQTLINTIHAENGRILLLNASKRSWDADQYRAILATAGCPVMLFR